MLGSKPSARSWKRRRLHWCSIHIRYWCISILSKAGFTVFSTEFLGGSAPCLQAIELWEIPSPALPTLLSSTCDLVGHWISDIPPTGCISPEAIVTCLAALPRLHQFNFAFKSAPPHCHRISARPVNRTVFPSLTSFTFMGPSEYLENLVS
jgi:hypothetical protein